MQLVALLGITKIHGKGRGRIQALSGINLTIDRGEFLAIVGTSGSGKSTLMHILGCLDRPTAGSYHLDGQEVSGLSSDKLAHLRNQRLGFVFQTFNLLGRLSALSNVAVPLTYAGMGSGEANRRARVLLQEVGLGARVGHLPSELSGGEQQRVAVARALVNDPDLILADEPTGSLDTRTGQEILDLFHKLNQEGRTVVVVTHDREVAARAHRVIEVRDGIISRDEGGHTR